ncbi:GTPase G3E family [Methanonatronarchaeum thermophilum]|uniref:GTPase G3E family n=1 Tax=Methanonatronarchaeum thermophilum TaxID=1927129 RepID=A0A1Y3GCV1_9EURY|nr:GTP-binding protein [Methanonatronarchaeum thermophilum]OUJ18143.1 GTPase G3E family [Methanonatronarchaeum thermophilum]
MGTKFVVVSGFLGSGKTTFLLNFGKELANKDVSVGILVNDFGEVTVDGETLEEYDMDATEIAQGCVCCEVRQSLVLSIRDLRKAFDPDVIILETSGVASLVPIFRTVDKYVDEIKTITLVDLARYDEIIDAFEVVGNQIRAADLILLNKKDIASEEQIKHTKKKVKKILDRNKMNTEIKEISARNGEGTEESINLVLEE